MSRLSLVVGICLFVCAGAQGELDLALENGDSVRGTLLPATETETFRFVCPEGARISATVAARGGGPRIAVTLSDFDAVELGGASGKRVRLRGVAVQRSGEHRIVVTSADGVTTGDYRMKLRWQSPASFRETSEVAARSTADVSFSADAGARVRFTLAAPRGSGATPSLVRVRDAEGALFPLGPGVTGDFVAPSTGSYALTYENTSDAAGAVRANARVRAPNAPARRLAATTREIPAGTDIRAAAVVGAAGGSLRIEGSGPLAGAEVTLPQNAVTRPTVVVLGTAPEIQPPVPSNATRATEPLFVGPSGLTLSPADAAIVSLPLGGGAPDETVLRVFASGASPPAEVVPGAEWDGQRVTFATSRFARFQAYHVAQAEIPAPFVVQTLSNRAGGEAAIGGGFAFVASPYSYDYLDGGAVGEGLVRVFQRVGATWVERGPLRAPESADSDLFGVSIAYRRSPLGPLDDSLLVGVRDVNGLDSPGADNPAIFEFVRNGDEWTYLRAVSGVPGYTFAVDEDRLVAAANSTSDLRLFARTASGWTQVEAISSPASPWVTTDLALKGTTLVSGAPWSANHGPGSAYRFDLGVSPATAVARYGAPAPEMLSNDFAYRVAVGADYVVASGHEGGSLDVFRLADDTRDASIAEVSGNRPPKFSGSFVVEGATLVAALNSDVPGYPFAGAYVFRRLDGSWTRVLSLDAADEAGVTGSEVVRAGGVAFDGTHVVVSLWLQSYSPVGHRSAIAFFEIPAE